MNWSSHLTLILIGILWKTLSSLCSDLPEPESFHPVLVPQSPVALKCKALWGYGLPKLIYHICSQAQRLLKIRACQITVISWPQREYYPHPSLLPPAPPHEPFIKPSWFPRTCNKSFQHRGFQVENRSSSLRFKDRSIFFFCCSLRDVNQRCCNWTFDINSAGSQDKALSH